MKPSRAELGLKAASFNQRRVDLEHFDIQIGGPGVEVCVAK